MITNTTQIDAVNCDTLANEGWRLKEDKVFFEGTTAYKIYERSISWKCLQVLQGNWDNFFSSKIEERKVEVKQNHPLNTLNTDIFNSIIKKLGPQSVFFLSSVDSKINLFLQKDTKDLKEIRLALFQARDFHDFAAKQLLHRTRFDDSIQAYKENEKADELDLRINSLFLRYNLYKINKFVIGNISVDLTIGLVGEYVDKRSENEILENLYSHPHHSVKLYTDLSKLSKVSLTQYLENFKIEDPVFKLKIKCFLDNFEGNLEEIKSLFCEYLEKDERYLLTELIKLLSIINHNAAEEYFKKNVDFLLNLQDDYMLLDKELIKFFLNEDILGESCQSKYNLKSPEDKIYTTSPIEAKNEFINYLKENDFKSEEEFELALEIDDEFRKCWKTCRDFMTKQMLITLFHEMIAVKPLTLLNRFKEKIDFVGLNADFFLFNVAEAANDFPTAMRIVNLMDDCDGKFKALDLILYDYSILKSIK